MPRIPSYGRMAVVTNGRVKYIGELKYSDKEAVLVSFYNSETDAYLLEVGYQYIRIWKDGAYTGTELATPYTN